MNGKDFIEALNSGHTLRSRKNNVMAVYHEDLYRVYTDDMSVMICGSCIRENPISTDEILLFDERGVIAVLDPKGFEVVE